MDARRILISLTAAVSVLASSILPALAAGPTATNVTGGGSNEGRFDAVIFVNDGNDNNVSEGSVKVKLFKRQDGAWVKKAVKQALLDSDLSSWHARFLNGPKRGTCKMVAVFSGTETWAASKGSIKGACNYWLW